MMGSTQLVCGEMTLELRREGWLKMCKVKGITFMTVETSSLREKAERQRMERRKASKPTPGI